MLKPKVLKALNDQINEEIFSAYLYYAMSAWFETQKFSGFAAWMRVQAVEEMKHADKIYKFILERGGEVELKAVAAPKATWKTPLEAFEAALKHEEHITACIHKLLELARAEKDYPTEIMLGWFVTEQVEEEAQTGDIVDKLKMVGTSVGGVFHLDHRLGKRED